MNTTERKRSLPKILIAAALVAVAGPALASSHREAPAISNDPAADNTDLWAWVSADLKTLHVVASYIPFEEPSGGPNFHKFSDDVLYQIHIVRGPTSLDDVATYSFKFTTAPLARADTAAGDFASQTALNGHGGREFFAQLSGYFGQTYTVTRTLGGTTTTIATGVPAAPPNVGPKTQATLKALGLISSGTYDDAYAATFIKPTSETGGGVTGQVFAGPRDDGFYADLGAIFDLANNQPGSGAAATRTAPVDTLAHYNTHSIVIDIPTAMLTASGTLPTAGASDANTIGVWASASRRKVSILRKNGTTSYIGPYTQVSRLGLPLINEAVIGIQDKDKFNRTTPAGDLANFGAYFLNPIIVKDAEAVGIYKALGVTDPTPFETNRLDIVKTINLSPGHAITSIGDVLRVDLGTQSQFPNGRMVGGGAAANQDQVNITDVLLSLLLTGKTSGVTQGATHNDRNYLTVFPYLALPWDGYTGGHGSPQ